MAEIDIAGALDLAKQLVEKLSAAAPAARVTLTGDLAGVRHFDVHDSKDPRGLFGAGEFFTLKLYVEDPPRKVELTAYCPGLTNTLTILSGETVTLTYEPAKGDQFATLVSIGMGRRDAPESVTDSAFRGTPPATGMDSQA